MSVIRHISDRILVMYLGQVVELAEKEDSVSHPAHPYTEALMEAVPVPDPQVKDQCKVLAGEIPSPIHAPAGCPFCTRCPQAKEVCRREKPAAEGDRNRDILWPVICTAEGGDTVKTLCYDASIKGGTYNLGSLHSGIFSLPE